MLPVAGGCVVVVVVVAGCVVVGAGWVVVGAGWVVADAPSSPPPQAAAANARTASNENQRFMTETSSDPEKRMPVTLSSSTDKAGGRFPTSARRDEIRL